MGFLFRIPAQNIITGNIQDPVNLTLGSVNLTSGAGFTDPTLITSPAVVLTSSGFSDPTLITSPAVVIMYGTATNDPVILAAGP